jgi:molybdopterin synthase sulfur carrier subunit
MQLTLIAFGITKDILGGRKVAFDLSGPATVGNLLQQLQQAYPPIDGLASLKVAVNSEYAQWDTPIGADDEVVLIPPVSGG